MSEAQEKPPASWGPDVCRAAVSVTFDNLGEAADLERGLWPHDARLGHHFSVRRTLPRILCMLDDVGIRATFFVEGINAEIYPGALLDIANSGHELGYHGWRHEHWPTLDPSEEARGLERGVQMMNDLGLRPSGFRPPGGRLTPSSTRLLARFDFSHCSPAGRGVGFAGPLVTVPFEWRLTDAYHYLPRFGRLREDATGSTAALPPSRFRETLASALEGIVRDGGHLSLLFHPFLGEPDERFAVMRDVLQKVHGMVQAGAVWCAPCRDVASWVRRRPGAFGVETVLDGTDI